MPTEADTCRLYVLPRLQAAGWEKEPHFLAEQRPITDGRIIPGTRSHTRRPPRKPDYLLCYRREFVLGVVEVKEQSRPATDGLQQAKEYAQMLGLKFAYATNGHQLIEFDFITNTERARSEFPTPDELWQRWLASEGQLSSSQQAQLLEPFSTSTDKGRRYYHQIAINRVVQALLSGKTRMLLTMATGTGKTAVAFQLCWKLWSSRWNRTGEHRRPKILFLADRNILVDDPMAKMFAPFGDARFKIESGKVNFGRELYFSIYQALAKDVNRPGLYKEYPRDFFDLIIVDECHRGSARDDSTWREILEWFHPACQLGMTATPLREDNRDTYLYFGNPLYTYSLRQGIEDGFLAPYRVHRVITAWDAAGWRPSKGDLDRYGREIPDAEYGTKDFERAVALKARTHAIARHLTKHLRETDPLAKTIVFCVDQPHAEEMRAALEKYRGPETRHLSDYVCRVTSDEGDVGLGHLGRFQDVEKNSPVILTTSQLLTTGVDAPTVKNVVLCRVIGSMSEFKQIIGRGTRVAEDAGKTWFTIIDYAGSAQAKFADPDFNGEPESIEESELPDPSVDPWEDDEPTPVAGDDEDSGSEGSGSGNIIREDPPPIDPPGPPQPPRKLYFDGGTVDVVTHLVYELDADGRQLRAVKLTDYAGEKVRTLFASPGELRADWSDPDRRAEIIQRLKEKGIEFDQLGATAGTPESDPFDLLCHLAYNAPLLTCKQRADKLKRDKPDFFDQFGPEARGIIEALLDKYAEHGPLQFKLPQALYNAPISNQGSVPEIIALFGGADKLRAAVNELQQHLYAA